MRKTLGRTSGLVGNNPPPRPPGDVVFDRSFKAVIELKNEVLEALLSALQVCGAIRGESDEIRMRLCLDEALVNAVVHGCKSDESKSVRVQAFLAAESWSVLVEDQGVGFREEDLPDPEAPENLEMEGGRGVHLIRSMMNGVQYWSGGRALLMTKRR